MVHSNVEHLPVTIIEPITPSMFASLKGCWQYRKLLMYFARRMTQMRYKGTILGWLWLFIRPIVTALCYTVIFGNLTQIPSEGLPYVLFFFTGMMVWAFFANGLMFCTRSLHANRRLITKLYFPKIIVPIASLAPFLFELLIFAAALVLLIGYYWFAKGMFYLSLRPATLLFLPFLFMTLLLSLGIGLWTSVLNSHAKDVKFTLPYLLQMWFFACPIVYPLSLIPDKWKWLVHFNPMAVTVEGFRWSLLGVGGVTFIEIVIAVGEILLVLWSGLWFFGKAESKMVDSL